MNRRAAVWTIVGAGSALITAGPGAAGVPQMELQTQVADVLDAWLKAWNASDMDAMFSLFTEDAHWVNIVGMHWRGKPEVEQAHRIFFDVMFKGVPQSLEEIESVVPTPGDGAIVVARWAMGAFKTPEGQVNPPSRDRMTMVLVRRGGRLMIAHGANVAIVEAAQAFDPIRGHPSKATGAS